MALNLVDYSDSESSSDDAGKAPPKRARAIDQEQQQQQQQQHTQRPRSLLNQRSPTTPTELPPLPSRFHDLYAASPRLAVRDDPSLHGGRQRAVPHEVGNWPSFVFLEWHLNTEEFSVLNEIIVHCKTIIAKHERQRLGIADDAAVLNKRAHDGKRKSRHRGREDDISKSTFDFSSSLLSDLGTELPLHLSLSAPNVLKTDERATFVDLLEERIKKASIKPFNITFTGFEWVSNNDGTRWFFVIKAKSKSTELSTLLRLTNLTFATYRQPALYSRNKSDSGFHVTIGWSLQAPEQELREEMESGINTEFGEKLAGLSMRGEEVKIKIGNNIKVLPLQAQVP